MSIELFVVVMFLSAIGAGMLGSLVGLGGGILIVPILTIGFGVDIHLAIGASIISVIATSSGAAAAFVRDHMTNIRVAMLLELATTFGAVSGAIVAAWINPKFLYLLFGGILIFSVFPMIKKLGEEIPRNVVNDEWADNLRLNSYYPDRKHGVVHYNVTRVPLGFVMMYVAGVVSGLLGIGSGALKVLAMDTAMRLPIKLSSATSNFMRGGTAADDIFASFFKALKPGAYVYHCATPSVAHHITSGMYGMILVEPEGGLPQVDREFYVMQGEIYTVEPFGTKGEREMDYDNLISERPEYFLFNSSVGALTNSHPLYANAGETVRIFFGVGGPNFTSSFHVIGEIFDHVYTFGSITSPPLMNVQTVTVPPGGATIVDFKIDRGGHYVLVDHALSRAERGLAGYLIVDGPENDDIMHSGPAKQDPAQ